MAWRILGSIAVLSLALTTACGDDDSGGGALDTGLPPDQKLSELDNADAQQACNALVDGLDNVLSQNEIDRINCTVAAVPQSVSEPAGGGQPQVDVAMCKELVNRCVGGESIGMQGGPDVDLNFSQDIQCDEAQVSSALQDCDATVGEYESCINGWLAEIDRLFSRINCDALRNLEDVQQTFGMGFVSMDMIDECNAVTAKCPDLSVGPGGPGGAEQPGGSNEPSASGCDETCVFSDDGDCDDGGDNSDTNLCGLGTDCTDCGPR